MSENPTYNFDMPWPPSVNGYWKPVKTPKMAILTMSKQGKGYREDAIAHLRDLGLKDLNITQPVSVALRLHPPKNFIYDIDNYCKGLFDSLTHGNFWKDDTLVQEMYVVKGEKATPGRIELTVEVLDANS